MINLRHTCLLCGHRKRTLLPFIAPGAGHSVWLCRYCIEALRTFVANVAVPRSGDTVGMIDEI